MAKMKAPAPDEPIEKQLWKAADKLRKNIDAAEYKHVVLGLIFLKYISAAFERLRATLIAGQGNYEGADPEDRDEYKAENVFFVPEAARWSTLQANARIPTIGKLVDDAMEALEKDNPSLKDVLPKVYARGNLDAANLGGVYRILTKPCPPELLRFSIIQACEHAQLLRDQRELFALKRCKVLLEGIVQGFSALVEARDAYLAGHQQRVTGLALAMGRELGLTPSELDTLRIAGLLHDIGKVYVPADFLNRPGILRQEELSVIQMHPEVGYDILKHLDQDWPVAVIIRQHHERMDGSGYPQGLMDRFIVQGARILAVADVVDAMCSHRPYRPSLGINAALAELEKNRGRLYDERCVDVCLALFREQGFKLETTPNTVALRG